MCSNQHSAPNHVREEFWGADSDLAKPPFPRHPRSLPSASSSSLGASSLQHSFRKRPLEREDVTLTAVHLSLPCSFFRKSPHLFSLNLSEWLLCPYPPPPPEHPSLLALFFFYQNTLSCSRVSHCLDTIYDAFILAGLLLQAAFRSHSVKMFFQCTLRTGSCSLSIFFDCLYLGTFPLPLSH